MTDHEQMEKVASELIETFDISAPPVPIESMLNQPKDGMWDKVDVAQLSGTFLSLKDPYSPRMSLARMLVRHIITSEWGKERGIDKLITDEDELRAFARMVIMPADMMGGLTARGRNPSTVSLQFEVPEEDARARLQELLSE